jgi:hypothetical protein
MTKIGTFENKAQIWSFKIHSYLLAKVFVVIFSIFFSIMYHMLSPYKKCWDEILIKNAFAY